MLTSIFVDGFRSLSQFSMSIHPGLNILIGPNGSGKSNVISFFQFLSHLTDSGLSDAVSKTGGAGAFFQKIGETKFKDEVRAIVGGTVQVNTREFPGGRGGVDYEYRFTIKASERFDSIIFSEQSLFIRAHDESESGPKLPLKTGGYEDWDLVLSTDINQRLAIPHIAESWLIRDGRRKTSLEEIKEQFIGEMAEISFQTTPLIQARTHYSMALAYISHDMSGGEALNVNPTKVKEAEDSARQPGIRSDGSGLAATLWHMRNEPNYGFYGYWRYLPGLSFSHRSRDAWSKVYGQLQSLMQLVNSQIKELAVINEPFDNQLKIKVRMLAPDDGYLDLPLSAMSDGTIKWASLITAILTSTSIFAIEEPENFLHPLMLAEIVKLVRETTVEKRSFVIMTTHSETLLNAADPTELLVISMEHGITRARRPQDPHQLADEIRETGFGLGHYYLAGDLGDA